MINIAIDGPSGAGKSTVAKALAKKLGYIYVDTGALYRAIGLYVRRAGVLPENSAGVIALLPEIDVRLAYENGEQKVLLSGEDVGSLIRTNEISAYASKVSAIPEVRTFLLELQRDMARKNNVIMDGRDIGTVILPDADVKIFMTASPRHAYAEDMRNFSQAGRASHSKRWRRLCTNATKTTARARWLPPSPPQMLYS